ncbi:TonB-dependent receptor [Catalinimonas sp. 4WD22]|uniref:SusC/RagA family TonB-linked outer membrane protein n=1 Tax=Catalinimonas locisalis TaxID=3133978 RepID=UPI003101681D
MNKDVLNLKIYFRISVFCLVGIALVCSPALAQNMTASIQTANQPTARPVYTQDEKQVALYELCNLLEKKFSISVNYESNVLDNKFVNRKKADDLLQTQKEKLSAKMREVLNDYNLNFKEFEGDNFIIVPQTEAQPQKLLPQSLAVPEADHQLVLNKVKSQEMGRILIQQYEQSISGKVTDLETGEGLPGVNILAKGTSTGTVSDMDGNYRLTVADEVTTLVFSSIGYETEEVQINNRSTIDLALSPDIQSLSEVVVVGYGTVKKSDLTGSVASVSSEELTAYPAIGAEQALQGRAAGVQVQANNGEPGAAYKVRIRGGTSINSSSDPLYVVDGFPGAAIPPPEDIASMEVLKDASATAIYGSRGANGVIMITTKKGEAGQTKIDLNTSWSLQNEINRLDLLNGEQFARYINEVDASADRDPTFANPAQFGEGTDWQDEIFQQGAIQNYQLSVSGGNENVRYYVSGVVYDQKGIIINSDFSRYSITSNLDIDATDKLKIGLNLFARRSSREGILSQEGSGGTNGAGVISSAFRFEPTQGIYDADGDYTISQIGDPFDNPVAIARERSNEQVSDRLQANIFGEYQIFENLTFRTTLGGSLDNMREGTYISTLLNAGRSVGGDGTINSGKDTDLINENYLTYNKTFDGVHELTVMAGYSYQSFRDESWSARGQSFITNAGLWWDLDGSSVWQQPGSGLIESELSSYYGRINYGFDSKYLLTFNARYDGSSRFARNNKWAFFPSGAFAWNMSEEGFLQDVDMLSQLKLRASYGITGNQGIGPYQSLAQFGTVFAVVNGQPANAVRPTDVANDNLSWESTAQLDIGVDVGFFNDRINLIADYYRMVTSDLLFSVPLPEYSGYSSQLQNIGEVENKGFEFTLNSRNLVGEFKWEMGLNLSLNRNKVLTLPEGNDIFYASNPGHILTDETQILREGEPVGTFFGWVYEGVAQSEDEVLEGAEGVGGEKYADLDGDGVLTNEDRTLIGNPHPDFIYGWNNTFRWRNFDLNMFIQGSQGNEIMNYTRFELDWLTGKNNATTDALDRWTPENTDTNVPKASFSRPARPSTRWIEDGSYVRLKNLALGYTLPATTMESIGLRALRVYVSAQNLLTITNYKGFDPEVNYQSGGNTNSNRNLGLDYGSYPNAKSYTVGLHIGF